MKPLPKISIIVAARLGQTDIPAIGAAKRLNYPSHLLEILVARGTQPAIQRNLAVRRAKGELLYFLDDDSIPDEGNLRRALKHFSCWGADVVGGPSLCPKDAPEPEQLFSRIMGSWAAFGPSSARYRKIGKTRTTTEKELILCNLFMRKSTFLNQRGFDGSLHPNEENALMDMVKKRGGQLVYDPDITVHRRPRPTTSQFLGMVMAYGKGRAEQFRLHPSPGSLFNFLPALFCLYLAWLPFLPFWALAPAALYGMSALFTAISLAYPSLRSIGVSVFLIVLSHISYGLGFWKGFLPLSLVRNKAPKDVMDVERIPS